LDYGDSLKCFTDCHRPNLFVIPQRNLFVIPQRNLFVIPQRNLFVIPQRSGGICFFSLHNDLHHRQKQP
jgi:hypothetical protein